MKYFFLGAVAVVCLIAGCEAMAQTPCPSGGVANDAARVCWTNAVLNVDGSTIPATGPASLATTEIYRSVCNADGTAGPTVETISVPATIGVALFTGLPPARHCFRARHTNVAGEVSASSAPVRKTTTAPAPPKPRQPNVTIS